MTTRNPVRQTEGDFTPLWWSTWSEDYLLWWTNPDDILLFSIFEETIRSLDDEDELSYWTLETDTWLVLQTDDSEDIEWNTWIPDYTIDRTPATY